MEEILKEVIWISGMLGTLVLVVLFVLKRRQYKAFIYAGLIFSCVLINSLDAYLDRHYVLWGSMFTQSLLPITITLTPIATILYLFYLASPNGTLPRWSLLFYLFPVLLFSYSCYVFYFSIPFGSLKQNFFNLSEFLKSQPEFWHFRLLQIFKRTYTLAGIMVIMLATIFFIPRILKRVEREYPEVREQFVNSFLVLLAIGVVICVANIIYYVIHTYYFYMLTLSFAGLITLGYIMYTKLTIKNRVSLPSLGTTSDESLLCRIAAYFEESKPWKDPELKIGDVANALCTNRTYLSTLLNDKFQTSFNHFVNSYRIAEAKKLILADGVQTKMQEVATKTGFNSYTTFFNAFKKETGMSPREFVEGLT